MALRERKPNVWQIRVYAGVDDITGKERWLSETVHGGKRAATRAEAALKTKAATILPTGKSRTVAAACTAVVDHLEPQRAPKTIAEYRRLTRIIAEDRIGMMPLAELTGRDLDGYYQRLATKGGRGKAGRTAAAVVVHHRFIRMVGNWSIRWDWIDRNPAMRATPPALHAKRRPVPETVAVREILAALDRQRDPTRATAVRVAAATGCRRGELTALHWSDIDELHRTVRVHRSIDTTPGAPFEKDTKTHQDRTVQIDAGTLALLADHRRYMKARAMQGGEHVVRDAYVFSDVLDCSAPTPPDRITQAVARAARKAGHSGVRLQDMRRWSGTSLIDAGEDAAAVAERLGHADPATTRRYYLGATSGSEDRAARILGEALG